MKLLNKILIILVTLLFYQVSPSCQEHLEHSTWNNLVNRLVSDGGRVNYKGFLEDEKLLDSYLTKISSHHPDSTWKKNDQLAYWINAYNAFTVKLILMHYPVQSIKDIGGSIFKVNTAWDIKFIHIGNKTYDLNNIEHGILRKQFNEPRIHFAVNCASISCPKLRNEAYIGSKLDQQLDDQTRTFINNPVNNLINSKSAELSKIFLWFKGDFNNENVNVIDFINKYADEKITKKNKISYKSYNWKLNDD